MLIPRIEITLSQIRHNARMLSELYGQKGISLMGVSKATLGDPSIAEAMIQGGVKFIADSRLENIQKMRCAGISTQFVLLRTALSQAESVIKDVDISLNTELETVKELSYYAKLQNKIHQIIVMVELGDLREGILPCDLSQFIKKTLDSPEKKHCWKKTFDLFYCKNVHFGCHGKFKPFIRLKKEFTSKNLKATICFK